MATKELDLLYHSYFSIGIGSDSDALSDASNEEQNIFEEGLYSSFDTTVVSSPDITFSSVDGRITFGAAGTYLIIGTVPPVVGGSTTMTLKM